MERNIKIRAAIIMLIILLLCTVSAFSALPHLLQKDTAYTAYLYQDGRLIQTISLSSENTTDQLLIGDYNASYNLIEISAGSICIAKASCPDQICVKQGAIHNSLVPITCLPNRIVIELKANTTDDTEPDAVTH